MEDGRAGSPCPPRRGRSPRPTVAAIAGVVVVLGAAVAAWWLWPEGETRQDAASTKKGLIKEVSPAAAPKAKVEPEAPRMPTRDESLFAKTNGYVKSPGKMMTEEGRVLTFPVPPPGQYRIVHANGCVYKCDSEGNFENITPVPVFDNAFENNLLGMAEQDGFFMPGLLKGYDKKEIMPLLRKEVEIKVGDSEEVIAQKEAVAALKTDIINYIEQGGTFDDYVTEMEKQSAHDRMLKRTALREIVKLLKEGNTSEAAQFYDKFNDTFTKQGVSPIKLPGHMTRAIEAARISEE